MKLYQILYRKKCVLFSIVFIVLTICSAGIIRADELKEGQVAVDFSLNDTRGNLFSLNTIGLKDKVLTIIYNDPGSRKVNEEDARNILFSDKRIDRQNLRVILIANIKASVIPEFLILRTLKEMHYGDEYTDTLILVDSDYTIHKLWGLKSEASNIVVLDKDRVCRYRYNGKLSNAEMEKMVKTIQAIQDKNMEARSNR